jgi:glutamyl-tRNA reductase
LNFIFAGINIEHAPLEVLEGVTVPSHDLEKYLQRLATHAGGGVILSTCNRMEIYSVTEDVAIGINQLKEYIETTSKSSRATNIDQYIYTLNGDAVAEHLFSVAAGLDSIALGESEITGQVTKALQAAGEAGTIDPSLSRMFHAALRTSRRIRKETALGRNRISISSLGVKELQNIVGDLSGLHVLLVGAGETGRLTANALRRYGADEIVVSSRSFERGSVLAEELGSSQVTVEKVPETLVGCDMLITCTASADPIITVETIRSVMDERPGRPLNILDVGMPRDVDPTVAEVSGVTLISLSELQLKSRENWTLRESASAQARELINDGISRFKERLTGIDSEPVVRSLGARTERMRREEVEQTLARMGGLTDQQAQLLEKMSRSLVRRILADPINFLRSEEAQAAESVQKVFALLEQDEDKTD